MAYMKLIKYFTDWRFGVNPYEPCVLKRIWIIIIFHMDDLKLLHVDPSVVTIIIKKLKDVYK